MNGWSNRQTWLVVNWGVNDFTVEDVEDIVNNESFDEYYKIRKIAEFMEENLTSLAEDIHPNSVNGTSVVSDLLVSAINLVDWYEIAHTWYYDNVKDI